MDLAYTRNQGKLRLVIAFIDSLEVGVRTYIHTPRLCIYAKLGLFEITFLNDESIL